MKHLVSGTAASSREKKSRPQIAQDGPVSLAVSRFPICSAPGSGNCDLSAFSSQASPGTLFHGLPMWYNRFQPNSKEAFHA